MKVLSWKRSEATRLGPIDPDAGFIGPVFSVAPEDADEEDNPRSARGLLYCAAICGVFVGVAAGLALAKFF